MAFEISPAVERAAIAVRDRSSGREIRLADWLIELLNDDDGKPARLIAAVGGSPIAIKDILADPDFFCVMAPAESELLEMARECGLSLRADPTLTTDLLLLAVLGVSQESTDRLGLSAKELANQLKSEDIGWSQSEFHVSPDVPQVSDHVDQLTPARVVDANLNRAREGLRVIEDYCRFVLNDAYQTKQVKALRHRLAAASNRLPIDLLLASRDVQGDVGTVVTAGAEYNRKSPAEVAHVNLKRLQEALRSAEEFGKLLSQDFAREVEQVRYSSYTLESALSATQHAHDRLDQARLYLLISAEQCRHGFERTLDESIAGGVNVVQLREKRLPDRELIARAELVRRRTSESGVLFIVNDRPDIARLVGADGVHVGQDDMSVAAVRRITGSDFLVGVSTHTVLQVRQAVADGADYIGVGPMFPSQTKAFDTFPGLPLLRAAIAITELPMFALGGIDVNTISDAVDSGAKRVAVSSAILSAEDPGHMAKELYRLLR